MTFANDKVFGAARLVAAALENLTEDEVKRAVQSALSGLGYGDMFIEESSIGFRMATDYSGIPAGPTIEEADG